MGTVAEWMDKKVEAGKKAGYIAEGFENPHLHYIPDQYVSRNTVEERHPEQKEARLAEEAAANEKLSREWYGIGENTVTVNLDPDTYEDSGPHGGGRWYNVPTTHPVTGQPMDLASAIAFALERGYLGAGFETGEIAVGAAQYRAYAGSEPTSPVPPDIWDVPFNPGGRAVDGFKYSNLDGVLIHTGRLTAEGRLGEEEHSQELNVDIQMAARDAAMAETFTKGRELFDTLLSVGMEEILPKRKPGSERSYTFKSSGGLRYSDKPDTMIGEERVD